MEKTEEFENLNGPHADIEQCSSSQLHCRITLKTVKHIVVSGPPPWGSQLSYL
ncbi:unnamed protein product, partial [Rangifer tarandus platyrhynchus]